MRIVRRTPSVPRLNAIQRVCIGRIRLAALRPPIATTAMIARPIDVRTMPAPMNPSCRICVLPRAQKMRTAQQTNPVCRVCARAMAPALRRHWMIVVWMSRTARMRAVPRRSVVWIPLVNTSGCRRVVRPTSNAMTKTRVRSINASMKNVCQRRYRGAVWLVRTTTRAMTLTRVRSIGARQRFA